MLRTTDPDLGTDRIGEGHRLMSKALRGDAAFGRESSGVGTADENSLGQTHASTHGTDRVDVEVGTGCTVSLVVVAAELSRPIDAGNERSVLLFDHDADHREREQCRAAFRCRRVIIDR